MILAFKYRPDRADLADTAVSVWTRSAFVHVEVLIETPERLAIAARSGPNHAVVRDTWETALAGGRWECYRVPVSSEADVRDFLLGQVGKAFNYPAIALSQIYGLRLNHRQAWFCSELAYVVCREFSGLAFPDVRPARVHPGRLRDYCLAVGCALINIDKEL